MIKIKSDIKERIDEYISSTGKIGVKEGKRWRAAYTDDDKEIRNLFKEIMEKEGLITEVDPVGNLYGKIKNIAVDNSLKKIIIGSHMDTVKNGGAYDGAAGIIIGIIALSEVLKRYGTPEVPVEVAALVEEEGSRYAMGYVGSRAVVHGLTEKELSAKDENEISLRDAMNEFGYDSNTVNKAKRDDIKAYLEVHIEQGPVLNTNRKKIGIVEKITGLNVLEVLVKGREDHAGTTPMNLRKDALVGASKIIYEIPKIVSRISETGTATVGMMKVLPGSSNVVPKEVRFTIDIRDIDPEKIKAITNKVKEEIKSLEEGDLEVEIRTEAEEVPVKLDKELANRSEEAVKNLKIPYIRMNSGAGHDAQIFAEKFPSGLLFIPCKDGRSHTPEEFATVEDIALAVEAVVEIIKNVAY